MSAIVIKSGNGTIFDFSTSFDPNVAEYGTAVPPDTASAILCLLPMQGQLLLPPYCPLTPLFPIFPLRKFFRYLFIYFSLYLFLFLPTKCQRQCAWNPTRMWGHNTVVVNHLHPH